MPRLSHVQQEVLYQLRQLASRSLLPEQLGTRLLEALRRVIPSDIQMLLGVDPASRLFNRLLALDERYASGFWHWIEHIYLVGEPCWGITFPGLMQAGIRTGILRDQIETSWGISPDLFHPLSTREFSRCYHDIGSPAGGMLRTFFAVDGHDLAALEMHRLEAHPPFQPTDLAFMHLVAPLIGKALRSAFDRERANTPLDLPITELTVPYSGTPASYNPGSDFDELTANRGGCGQRRRLAGSHAGTATRTLRACGASKLSAHPGRAAGV